MRIGFNLPNSGSLSVPATMARIAQEGEALGYDYLTLTDHVVLPDMKAPGYSESGEFYGADPAVRHEQLVRLAWITARTGRVRLVSAVLVVPRRPAVLTAKMLATIDMLSGGGRGEGSLKSEFDALGASPFAERGTVTDKYPAAFRALRTDASSACWRHGAGGADADGA
jgi:alkanesulfonate monooxygenase SsuD/methylene tetrahydromethanopterin reductase-like flavin-dependent oxidoreductase (luciferase family)